MANRKQADANFGRLLRAKRESAGLTQAALGEAVGITANTIARIERGESEPTWATAKAFADALVRVRC